MLASMYGRTELVRLLVKHLDINLLDFKPQENTNQEIINITEEQKGKDRQVVDNLRSDNEGTQKTAIIEISKNDPKYKTALPPKELANNHSNMLDYAIGYHGKDAFGEDLDNILRELFPTKAGRLFYLSDDARKNKEKATKIQAEWRKISSQQQVDA